jgi:predicted KAP-like P-loop ATPase
MWPDNETNVDLLGFEYLVDQLEVLLTTERLLPLTVLVSGDWGSGKSSLMEVARGRLEAKEGFICVKFTPWRFEDFHYGKVALMAAVVDAIADYVDERKGVLTVAIEKVDALRRTLQRWGMWKNAAMLGAAASGLGPEEAGLVGGAADVVGSLGGDEQKEPRRTFESVAHFHHDFEELIESLGDDVKAVVVFIDDMDRCSATETIVETFEAMRLFLHAPKTAYVVGAHEAIVEAALDSRYEGRREGDEDIGGHWLEKMLQHRIPVPPLGEPEVLTYVNLLFAELYMTSDQFALVRARADENRNNNPFQLAMNEGIARDTVGELSPELVKGLALAARIGPVLAQNMRGNPRETKRFLNDLFVRMETATKRGMDLDPGKLAKLMLLEQLLDRQHFEQVFKWQLASDTGAPAELRLAEQLTRGQKPKSVPAEVREWVTQPKVANWLKVEPLLADTNLAPYFTFSRDRLAGLITAPRLSAELQNLLTGLQNAKVPPQRTKAVRDTLDLDPQTRAELTPALLDAAEADLGGVAAKSLVELAAQAPEVATAMFAWLDKLAVSKVNGTFVLTFAATFKADARTRPLLQRWSERGKSDVKRQADRALEKG